MFPLLDNPRRRGIVGLRGDQVTAATHLSDQLEAQIAASIVRERQRIAYALHDGLGQELTGLSFLVRSIAESIGPVDERAAGDLRDVAARLNGAIEGLRGLTQELARAATPATDILQVLRELVRRSAAQHGIEVTCQARGMDRLQLSAECTEHLYLIVQEALSNAVRHGRSSRVSISVSTTLDRLNLRIADNGSGFEMAAPLSGGIGLSAMLHRARSIGGTLTVQSAPGTGTRVEVSCPRTATS